MSRPSTPRREQTRQRLATAATELIAERGMSASTVELICDRAGFTRGAYYSAFGSREELYRAVLEVNQDLQRQWIRQSTTTLAELLATRPDLLTGPIAERLAVAAEVSLGLHGGDEFPLGPGGPDPWTIAALVPIELALYAVREPESRPLFLATQTEMHEELGAFVISLAELLGLRVAVDRQQAGVALQSVVLAVARRAMTFDTAPAQVLSVRLAQLLGCLVGGGED
ncbi:MAG TPA: helix-turn-helix domain-containing protein [Dermatophilaceae bacterium]|nr:helix-turn-helix domain-containing protein [Dermatophilaceae bacterium]